jgi:hypothetical protein
MCRIDLGAGKGANSLLPSMGLLTQGAGMMSCPAHNLAHLPGPPSGDLRFDFAFLFAGIVKPQWRFDSRCSLFGPLHRGQNEPPIDRLLCASLDFAQADVARHRGDLKH